MFSRHTTFADQLHAIKVSHFATSTYQFPPAAFDRSNTTTSSPDAFRYFALTTPLTPAPMIATRFGGADGDSFDSEATSLGAEDLLKKREWIDEIKEDIELLLSMSKTESRM